jgi:hypothetical protein
VSWITAKHAEEFHKLQCCQELHCRIGFRVCRKENVLDAPFTALSYTDHFQGSSLKLDWWLVLTTEISFFSSSSPETVEVVAKDKVAISFTSGQEL